MKRLLLMVGVLLFCGVGHATLYRWTGTEGSTGSFDVGSDGGLRLATLSFDNIAWQGFVSPYATQTPTVGNTRMYVADCLMHSDSGDDVGEYSFWEKTGLPDDGTWWMRIGNNAVGGRILSFAPESDPAPTPEPSTFALCSAALLFYFLWRRIRLN